MAMSKKFPNLRELGFYYPKQKVNLFANYFRNLEKPPLIYDTDFVDLDTGIIHENLRYLKIQLSETFFEDFLSNFL